MEREGHDDGVPGDQNGTQREMRTNVKPMSGEQTEQNWS
jgi:hypothetical protein